MNQENLLNDIKNMLIVNYPSKDIPGIIDKLIPIVNNYNIEIKSTEVATVDNSSIAILKMFAGSLMAEGKAEGTVRQYIKILRRFYDFIEKELIDVNQYDIRRWLLFLSENTEKTTRNNYRSYLSSFYSWMHREKMISENPVCAVRPIKINRKIESEISDVDLDKIRITCGGNVRTRAIIEVLYSSGIRREELCNLNIEDIDFNQRSIHVVSGKGDKDRVSYMSVLAMKYLKDYIATRNDDNKALFVTANKKHTRLTTEALGKLVSRLGTKSEVESVHPHKFRHTFATNSYNKGMDLRTIQDLLGHENINTTMRYVTNSSSRKMAEYNRFWR